MEKDEDIKMKKVVKKATGGEKVVTIVPRVHMRIHQ